jgi:hypothetical protein
MNPDPSVWREHPSQLVGFKSIDHLINMFHQPCPSQHLINKRGRRRPHDLLPIQPFFELGELQV